MASLRTLGAKAAGQLDEYLMSTGGFSIDQLMELAGLSVAQTAFSLLPKQSSSSSKSKIVIACGPGNNGGDGLVAARHLAHFDCQPIVFYPKQPNKELYQRLVTQLKALAVPVHSNPSTFPEEAAKADLVIDAVFGFSFSGEVREPFPAIIAALEKSRDKVLAVDAPSSWNIEDGPPKEGPGSGYMPASLLSLTAPKPLVKFLDAKTRHFVGGRFLGKDVADRFGIDVPVYPSSDQFVEL